MANDKLIYASSARKAILKEDPKLAYCIDSIPGVDAVEVVHGRWIWTMTGEEDYEQYYRCSECNDYMYSEYNYCPNCGAKMDGDWNG